MNPFEPGEEMIARLKKFAAVLIPAKADMPGAGEVAQIETYLGRALRSGAYPPAEIEEAFERLAGEPDWAAAKALAKAEPAVFGLLSRLASAAYFMAPDVMHRLGYPADRRQPAGPEDFMAEFETGIFDQMMAREPHFRDPRRPLGEKT